MGAGRGVNRQRVHLGDAGRGVNRQRETLLIEWFSELADRLHRVRVCCGDWSRVTGPTVTWHHGMTGVFLDPPYSHDERQAGLYRVDHDIADDVRRWAIENGDNPLLRIVLCGYEGEHDMPDNWDTVHWKASGGYGSQGDGAGRANAEREVIHFSPACLKPDRPVQLSLLDTAS